MATAQPHLLSPPALEGQLTLPLSLPQTSRPIHLQEVWATLSPQQQALFRQQIVQLCCSLIKQSQQEVHNEQR
ncbi:MAG: hypothetical protein LC775_04945 [Acidobacteria bacterium]|nr:hypothetical protein [Acidobacteriota bacterium]